MSLIIPANPGFCVLEATIENGLAVDAVQVPIIAWSIKDTGTKGYMGNPDNLPIPICLIEGEYPVWQAIKTDTGNVFDNNNSEYESVEDWVGVNRKLPGV